MYLQPIVSPILKDKDADTHFSCPISIEFQIETRAREIVLPFALIT